jgi:hypothetical protein
LMSWIIVEMFSPVGLYFANLNFWFTFCRLRTCLDFVSSKEIWRDVEHWAEEYGYKLKSQSGTERLYLYKSSFWTFSRSRYPTYLLIRQDGDKVHVEAWKKRGKREVAVDEFALLLNFPSQNMDVIRINKLLTVLESQLKIRESFEPRTCLDFISNKEIWSDVGHWAKEYGYELKNQSGMERVYKKNTFSGIIYLLICQKADKVHVEAWIDVGVFWCSKEIAIYEEDALHKALPWKENVEQINRLLAALEAPQLVIPPYMAWLSSRSHYPFSSRTGL